jgi:hypothetical protein
VEAIHFKLRQIIFVAEKFMVTTTKKVEAIDVCWHKRLVLQVNSCVPSGHPTF